MATLEQIVNGWTQHFWSADHEIEWVAAETEHELWLNENTVILSRIDAFGKDADGAMFFGEWKTSNPRDKKTWKQTWRLNAQSLTYGLVAQSAYPGCERFTVRKAFKTDPPSYDHAWYKYHPVELLHWKHELIGMANEIRGYLKDGGTPWPTNYDACFAYGANNVCPFFESSCAIMDFQKRPYAAIDRVSPMEDSLRARLNGEVDELVILSPSRIKLWNQCRERYRREYVDHLSGPESEALKLGSDFHTEIGKYIQGMVKNGRASR